MDTITHGIVGALAGKALFAGRDVPPATAGAARRRALSSPTARAAIVACTLGSMFPDIDIFAGPLAHNPLAIMEWHRNITHSAVHAAGLGAAIGCRVDAARALVKWKPPPFLDAVRNLRRGNRHAIFLDLVTNFGTMVWSPLRYSRPAWDWIFILDLTLTAIALVPQFAAWCYREPAQFWLRAVGVWAALTAGAFGAYLFASAVGIRISDRGRRRGERHLRSHHFSLPAAQGAGFSWTRASWCRAGLAVLCAYIGVGGCGASQSACGRGTLRGRATFAGGKPRGASAAADADALGRIGQHSGRRLAHHISRTRRRSRKHAILCRRAVRSHLSKRRRNCAMSRFIFGSRDFRSGESCSGKGTKQWSKFPTCDSSAKEIPLRRADPPGSRSFAGMRPRTRGIHV